MQRPDGASFVERQGSDATTDRFHFICDIASGGIGRVELAAKVDGRFRRLFAIKRLQDAYKNDTEFLEMFLEEARIAGLVRHPNVVPVLDVGVDARGPFLAMDYVEGVSADALLREHLRRGIAVPVQVALSIVIDAAEGLHAAHETRDGAGAPLMLVHRDVSPQNILVGYDGVSRVTDFGIAKALGRSTHTDAGVLKGKLGYMSPEQLRFEELDRRSDLFALGVVLYELLAGTRLYRSAQGADGPRRILNEPPPDVGDVRPDLPPELVECVFRMLAKEPDARPATGREVARTLEAVRAELIETEGRLEVEAHVQSLFGDRRREDSERIAGAIERTDFGRTPAPDTARSEAPTRVTRPPAGRRWAWLAAGLVLSACAGVAAWWLAPSAPVAPPREAPAASIAAAPTAPIPVPAEVAPPSPPEPSPAPPPAEPTASGPLPEVRARHRTRTRPAAPSEGAAPEAAEGPRIWGWSEN